MTAARDDRADDLMDRLMVGEILSPADIFFLDRYWIDNSSCAMMQKCHICDIWRMQAINLERLLAETKQAGDK
jgi:hypothetical protein